MTKPSGRVITFTLLSEMKISGEIFPRGPEVRESVVNH